MYLKIRVMNVNNLGCFLTGRFQLYKLHIGVANGAAGAVAAAPIIWLVVVIAEITGFLPPQTNVSLPI